MIPILPIIPIPRLLIAICAAVIFAGDCHGQGQTGKSRACTLDLSEEKKVSNPTEADIRAGVTSLDGDKNIYVIVRTDAKHWIQASWAAEGVVDFDFADGSRDAQYHTPKRYPKEIAMKVLVSYLSGTADWKKLVEWEKAG